MAIEQGRASDLASVEMLCDCLEAKTLGGLAVEEQLGVNREPVGNR